MDSLKNYLKRLRSDGRTQLYTLAIGSAGIYVAYQVWQRYSSREGYLYTPDSLKAPLGNLGHVNAPADGLKKIDDKITSQKDIPVTGQSSRHMLHDVGRTEYRKKHVFAHEPDGVGVGHVAVHNEDYNAPRDQPGILNNDDFVHFIWGGIDASRYTVIIDVNTMAGERFKSIGKLASSVELPRTVLGANTPIALIPDSDDLPRFSAKLVRGSTYVVPPHCNGSGHFQMERHGIDVPNGI